MDLTPPTASSVEAQNSERLTPAPEKIHLRGLENLTSKDITAFVNEYSAHPFDRIEWIDDTSANINYASSELALEALQSFVLPEHATSSASSLDSIPAKSFPGLPNTQLQVRLAVVGDKKQPGARDRSRFYLLNPEHDPHERRRDSGERSGGRDIRRFRDREEDYKRSYHERDNGRQRRRTPDFDASLYDDDQATLAKRVSVERDTPPPRYEERRPKPRGRGARKELFPERGAGGGGRLRDRSASPMRERDEGETVRDDLAADERAKRLREETARANRSSAQAIKNRLRRSAEPHLELFPEKAAGNRSKSAFESDETADLFAEKMRIPIMDGSKDLFSNKRSLESRITGDSGRLNGGSRGLKIRGQAALQPPKQGLSIKGMAAAGAMPKELFPAKAGLNAGKELFADRVTGRGGRRQRAGDLFQ